MYVTISLFSFLLGVTISSLGNINFYFGVFLLLGSLLAFLYILIKQRKNKIHKLVIGFVCLLLGLSIGFIRTNHVKAEIESIKVPNKEIDIESIVIEPPRISGFSIRSYLLVDKIGDSKLNKKIKVLGILPQSTEIAYGEKLKLTGIFETPENFTGSNGIEFDYISYLKAQNVKYIFKAKKVEMISKNHAPLLKTELYKIRNTFELAIRRALHAPHGGLVEGVLLGNKDGLGKDLKDSMTKAGVIHIAVLSGYNIMLVAYLVLRLLSFAGHKIKLIATICIILLFVLMSGAEPPAVRAGILAFIVLWGSFHHRSLHLGRAILVVAFLMVFWNPWALLYNVSFQLSFLATLGLVYVTPFISNLLGFITEKFQLREIISSTIATQIAVTPLLLFATGQLALMSLPANILILLVVPYLMLFGFITGLTSLIWIYLAIPTSIITTVLSSYILLVVSFISNLPFASITFHISSAWTLVGIYLFLVGVFVFSNKRLGIRR